nr:hypothetical protein [Chloroflexota bacterium]
VALDLFLWFGPRVSVAPLIGPLLARPDLARGLGPNDAQAFEATRQAILAMADEVNLLAMLAPIWFGVPSIMPALGGGQGSFTFVTSWATALLIGLGVSLVGTLLGCLYRAVIAQQVRDDAVSGRALPAEALRAWSRSIGLALLVVGIGALLALPVAIVTVGAALIARELASFGVTIAMTLALWAWLYLFFAPDAIFVGRVGPLRAIARSIAFVRANFWAAFRLVALVQIILLGMEQVWLALATRTPWGPALGIVGNAYITSGLIAASMLFYRERSEALLAARPVAAVHEA